MAYARRIGYCASQVEGNFTVYRSRITDKLQAERTVDAWKAENPNLKFIVEAIYSSSKEPMLIGYCRFSDLDKNGSVTLNKEQMPGHYAVFADPYIYLNDTTGTLNEENEGS